MNSDIRPLKLLFVIDNLSTGGAQRQMINLATGLSQRGHLVEIFCYTPGDLLAQPLIEAGIRIHWQYKRNRFSPGVILELRKLIRKSDFDLVLAFLTTPNFYAILTGRLLSLKRVPVIVSERSCDLIGVSATDQFARWFYRFATHIVTNSHHQRISLSKKYPRLKKRLTTIYNGYDLEEFTPPASEPNNQPLQILCIASVSPYKNGMRLVEALNILGQKDAVYPQVDWIGQLVMMGIRLQSINEMNAAIKKYGLESQWNWLHQRSDVINQLQQHDVLIHPSYIEGLPNVVCEALSCGRPVIVSDTLDHPLLVQDGISGYLFNHEDANDLAEKIKMLMNLSIEERTTMGNNGRKFAETHLSQERLVDDYEQLFLRIFGES